MTDEIDERKLVKGLQEDDRQSLAWAYDAFGAAAFSLAVGVLRSATEAEEVVQESFLALWRQAERLDPARGVRGYLLSIVHNRSVDRMRRRLRRPEVALDLDLPLRSPVEDPADEVVRLSERDRVRGALSSLSQDQRRTVEMVYFQGMTVNEAARRMQVPAGTVKSRLRLALGHLRRELKE